MGGQTLVGPLKETIQYGSVVQFSIVKVKIHEKSLL